MNALNFVLRAVQIAAWFAGAYAFTEIVRRDAVGVTPIAWLVGVLLCGFGAMFVITFLISLVRFGPKAAMTLKWD